MSEKSSIFSKPQIRSFVFEERIFLIYFFHFDFQPTSHIVHKVVEQG